MLKPENKIITKQGFKILKSGNVEQLSDDERIVFNKLWLYPGKGPVANGVFTQNMNGVSVGEMGQGDKVCPDLLNPGDPPLLIELPEGKFKRLSEILVVGTAADGVFFKYWEP